MSSKIILTTIGCLDNELENEDNPIQDDFDDNFKQDYIDLLKNDLTLIEDLCSKWLSVRDDIKFEKFISKIETFMDRNTLVFRK